MSAAFSTPADTAFERLIQDVATLSGQPNAAGQELFGLEFESDELLASVLPHPRDNQRLIIEVNIGSIDLNQMRAAGDVFLMLHQLNDRARREHDWVITIDQDLALTLSLVRAIAELDAPALQALMAEGLDCARALESIWQSVARDEAAIAPEPSSQGASHTQIRG